MMEPKEVIPTWKTFYTVNTGSHDHCVYVYNEHRVSHDQFITMASLFVYILMLCHCLYKLLPPDTVQNKEYKVHGQ